MDQTFGFTCTLDVKLLQKHMKYNYSSSNPCLVIKLLSKTSVPWKWVTCNLGSFQTPSLFGIKTLLFLDHSNLLNYLISGLKA